MAYLEFLTSRVRTYKQAHLNGGFYQQRTFGKKGATTGLRTKLPLDDQGFFWLW
jgi:hypothetical protein